jgi:hypothetical protein
VPSIHRRFALRSGPVQLFFFCFQIKFLHLCKSC